MFHEIKPSLYQTKNTSYPPAPCTIDNVNIEGILSETLNGEQFILHNSIHPIFGRLESIKQLSKSDNDRLIFNGTFNSCPSRFYQLYTVHSVNSELSTPKLYSLLPDKKGPTYISIFNSILNLCHMNNISLNPKFIIINFEQAVILALKLIFPNAIIKGCNFHFYKCLYTKLQDLGSQSAFINKKSSDMNEINVRNLYKKVCALVFMPPQEISKLWVMIMDEYQDIENIEGFYDYITNTW